MRRRRLRSESGVTLIDTLVGIGLMMIVFAGIAATFELALDIMANNKARAGAIALADERMEYIHSLSYAAIGTVGGVPSGTIAPSESVSLNGIHYTRRTIVAYEDDPKDGTGAADANGIVEDYKAVKVDLAWSARGGTRHVTLVSRISPSAGLETNPCGSPCGTLTIHVVNAAGAALPSASVAITNAGTSPTISINTFTNASGTASVIGAPAATNYHVSVTEAGYSTAQTYPATSQNTNPNPGNLTVSANQTTSATFAIDALGQKSIQLLAWIGGQSTTTMGVVSLSLQGAKTIGTGPSGLVYKYSSTLASGANGSLSVPGLEWDTYTIAVPASSGYDIASACSPQPEALAPGASQTSTLYLAAHTANSLLVDVRSSASGSLLPNAFVLISRSGFSTGTSTDPWGSRFSPALCLRQITPFQLAQRVMQLARRTT
ncbi:MAG TPA: carboxypeptidase-like regulatory domain-containing protein [Candidatus Paceibacterota bacterium]|nr:carboxypeptidase-like regulatory domain-containing protein [Candidatus Paceibacterota bacterium]